MRGAEPLEGGEHRNESLSAGTQPQNRSGVRAAQGSRGHLSIMDPGPIRWEVFHLQGLLPQLALQALRA